MLKILLFLLFALSVLINGSPAFAATSFIENFDENNENIWVYQQNTGDIAYSNGTVILSSKFWNFPYLYNKDPIIINDADKLKIRFSYDKIGEMGDGIGYGFYSNEIGAHYQLGIWGDLGGLYVFYNDFSKPQYGSCMDMSLASNNSKDRKIFYIPITSDNWHEVLFVREGTKYILYLDNVFLYETPDNQCIPDRFLLGNPFGQQGSNDWSVVKIDYLKIFNGEEIELKPKIILIPGLGASWNSRALVYNDSVPDSEWEMTPFVNNYKSIIDGLKANNLKEDEDFFVWNYDWRRPISQSVTAFDGFVDSLSIGSEEKIEVVGHSLGGVIGRIWQQENINDSRIDNVISLGSPHEGSVKAYEVWSGGSVLDNPDMGNIALNILTKLQSRQGLTRAATIQSYAPVLKDLIPTFNFIKKNGLLVANSTLNVNSQNSYLKSVSPSSSIWPHFDAVVGGGVLTKSEINVSPRSSYDTVLGNWVDGVPVSYSNADGDGTVLKTSQKYDQDGGGYAEIGSNHGEIINKSLGWVMNKLGLQSSGVSLDDINYRNKIIFYIGSPAYLKVKCDNAEEVTSDNMGFVFINNNNYAKCTVKVVGTGNGEYHLVEGKSDNEDSWKYWQGVITSGEVVTMNINVNTGEISQDANNDVFLKRIILQDIEKLLESNQGNTTLISARTRLHGGIYNLVLDDILKFKINKKEILITDRIIDNLTMLLAVTTPQKTASQVSSQRQIVIQGNALVSKTTLLYQRQGIYPKVFGATNYKNYEELLRKADANSKTLNNNLAYWRLVAAQKYLQMVW